MSDAQSLLDFVADQLSALDGLVAKRLFGGIGLSANGIQFAMIMGPELYFAVNDATRPQYEAMGSTCFTYQTKKRQVDVRKYYRVPDVVIEDRERLLSLAVESVRVAQTAQRGRVRRSKMGLAPLLPD